MPSPSAAETPPARIKVLVDTDIGNDPDDALALAYLALHPRCELVGITTVTGGDARKRAVIADFLLRLCAAQTNTRGDANANANVPIVAGRGSPLQARPGRAKQDTVLLYDALAQLQIRAGQSPSNSKGLDSWPLHVEGTENPAVPFMRETIGPLGNVAELVAADPEILGLCRGVVSMGGKFAPEGAWAWEADAPRRQEWNVLVDQAAAETVLCAPPPAGKIARHQHRFVGLDVTMDTTVRRDRFAARFGRVPGPLGEFLRDVVARWMGQARDPGDARDPAELADHERKNYQRFHDPLAAAVIFRPELCEWRTGSVSMEEDGTTTFVEGEGGTDVVAWKLSSKDEFLEEYLSVVAGDASAT